MRRLISCSISLAMLLGLSSCFKKVEEPPPVVPPGSSCDYSFKENSLINSGWTKVFEENFDSNLDKWSVWNSGAYNGELQHYQPANATLESGILVITAKEETVTGAVSPGSGSTKSFAFTSARIESDTTFSASAASPKLRFVARIKLPAGTGMWPAFWTYGANWPTNGEIDIMEAKGSEPKKYGTNYFYGTQNGQNLVNGQDATITAGASLTDCFHVYEGVWEKNKLSFYLDGELVDEKTGSYVTAMYGKTQWITLNAAVGGNYFGPNLDPNTIQPGTMYVDWVKVFKSN